MKYEKGFFPTTWDKLVKIVTSMVWSLLISLTILFTLIPDLPSILRIGIITLNVAILLVPFLWAPRGYVHKKNLVIVKRIIGDLEINVSKAPKIWKWTWYGARLWASGGLYGYFGIFIFKGIGKVWMYATNRNNLILIEDSKNRKYLISPDNTDRFTYLLNQSLIPS